MTTYYYNNVTQEHYKSSPDHGIPVSLSSGRSHGSMSSCFSSIKVTVECAGLALPSKTDKSLNSFTVLVIKLHMYVCSYTYRVHNENTFDFFCMFLIVVALAIVLMSHGLKKRK